MKKLNFHHYVETSAYTGQNINSLFETVTKHLYFLNEDNIETFVRLVSNLCLESRQRRVRQRELYLIKGRTLKLNSSPKEERMLLIYQ
jgi:hypothetical protein